MIRLLPCLLLLACGPKTNDSAGERTVLVQLIEVVIDIEPEPSDLQVSEPDWLKMDHCGQVSLIEDTLQVQGPLDPKVTAVALLRYASPWGSIFSQGGSIELEVDLSEPADIHAALKPDRVLYTLEAGVGDTGVPGGESTWSYGPNEFDSDTTALELHKRYPLLEATVDEVEPMGCQRRR